MLAQSVLLPGHDANTHLMNATATESFITSNTVGDLKMTAADKVCHQSRDRRREGGGKRSRT